MRGQRPFLEDHPLQSAAIIFEQFGGAQIARDQDRILPQSRLRRRAQLPRHNAQQPVRQILEIVHPLGEQWIVDLAHPHPRALLDTLDGGLGGQPRINGFVDPSAPPLVISEHLIGLDDLARFAVNAEIGLACHPVDLFAHLVERRIDAVPLGFGIFSYGVFDDDARLVIDGVPPRHPFDQFQARQSYALRSLDLVAVKPLFIDEPGICDQFGQHHCDGLQCFDLDFFVPARVDMLDAQHSDRSLASNDRNTGKRMEYLLTRFRLVGKIGMRRRFVEVHSFDIGGDCANQPLTQRQLGDMDRFLLQPTRRVKLENAVAQQVDRTDFAFQCLGDYAGDLIKFGLRTRSSGHNLVKAGENFAGRGSGTGHEPCATRCTKGFQPVLSGGKPFALRLQKFQARTVTPLL